VKRLAGRPPWLRLRIGDYRALLRPLTTEELQELPDDFDQAYLVARIVNRRDLERAVEKL
jgi:hypothetical protein